MQRNKFVRIFERQNTLICIICDNIDERGRCPHWSIPHICGCHPYRETHVVKSGLKLFNNSTDKIVATFLECNMKEYNCNNDCNECNFAKAKNKYLNDLK